MKRKQIKKVLSAMTVLSLVMTLMTSPVFADKGGKPNENSGKTTPIEDITTSDSEQSASTAATTEEAMTEATTEKTTEATTEAATETTTEATSETTTEATPEVTTPSFDSTDKTMIKVKDEQVGFSGNEITVTFHLTDGDKNFNFDPQGGGWKNSEFVNELGEANNISVTIYDKTTGKSYTGTLTTNHGTEEDSSNPGGNGNGNDPYWLKDIEEVPETTTTAEPETTTTAEPETTTTAEPETTTTSESATTTTTTTAESATTTTTTTTTTTEPQEPGTTPSVVVPSEPSEPSVPSEPTKPTEEPTKPTEEPTEPTEEPTEPTEEPTEPTEEVTEPTEPSVTTTTEEPEKQTTAKTKPNTTGEDAEVPEDDIPKTGDVSMFWALLSGVSGLGLLGVTASDKKKKKNK